MKSIERMEENIDTLRVANEEAQLRAELAEREAIIAELKRKYGSNWRKILGVQDLSLATLRSFARTANAGLRQQAQSLTVKDSGVNLEHLRRGVDLSHLRRM